MHGMLQARQRCVPRTYGWAGTAPDLHRPTPLTHQHGNGRYSRLPSLAQWVGSWAGFGNPTNPRARTLPLPRHTPKPRRIVHGWEELAIPGPDAAAWVPLPRIAEARGGRPAAGEIPGRSFGMSTVCDGEGSAPPLVGGPHRFPLTEQRAGYGVRDELRLRRVSPVLVAEALRRGGIPQSDRWGVQRSRGQPEYWNIRRPRLRFS